jgi:hypothetical protein
MSYATVTQRLSDFFPRKLPKDEQVYRDYTLPQQFWSYYTDSSYSGIRYNTYLGDVVPVNTYDVTTKGGYFNYINAIDTVYNNDGTYRYNLIAGYNRITSVNGNNNIYLGSNSNPNSINTNNAISIGNDVDLISEHILFRTNKNKGQIDIQTPKNQNEKCSIDLEGNINISLSSSNIGYDDSNQYIVSSNISLNSSNIFLSSSYFNVFDTSENIRSCNINLSGSDFNVYDTSENVSSCNINLNDSYFNVYNTSENVSSCNITLTGNDIFSKTLSANIDNSEFRITSTSQEMSSSDVYLNNSTFSASNSNLLFNNMNLKFERKTTALGISAVSDRNGMFSYSTNGFSNIGDAQKSNFIFIGTTTTNNLTEIFCDSGNGRMTIPINKIWSGIINVVGCDSSGIYCSRFCRQVTIGNRNGSMILYGTVATVGTDLIASVGGSQTSSEVVISANSTYDALTIQVRGYSGYTFRWIASVDGVEMKFV